MGRLRSIILTTYDELMNKVTWPTWDELVNSTIIVLVASIIFALVIFVIDKLTDLATNGFLYNLL